MSNNYINNPFLLILLWNANGLTQNKNELEFLLYNKKNKYCFNYGNTYITK